MSVTFLTHEQVMFLNAHQIKLYTPGEMVGVKDWTMLDSAINRPKQSAFGEDAYPHVIHKAAALYESLAKNHAFQNANKRTALASLYMFLRKNGFKLVADKKEAEDFTVKVVEDKLPPVSFNEIADWIDQNVIMKEER
ncbi:hypothetical protein B9K06_22295 [Bacillus sp. OG2]|nr:hypothetical protein B9K06_22295 [Bacillus sp. OG2]